MIFTIKSTVVFEYANAISILGIIFFLASNEELVDCLIERDSLSMEQDSILVDIEDLTR